jgi:hypothetical protein
MDTLDKYREQAKDLLPNPEGYHSGELANDIRRALIQAHANGLRQAAERSDCGFYEALFSGMANELEKSL